MAYTFKHGDRPLEGYTIQRAVGRGGFGEVYYAVADSGKQVALKYLRDNPEVELRGIAHVMNLKSPHLITIYDVRQAEAGEPFVIMEYITGPSLRDMLIAEGAGMSPGKVAFLLKGMAEGLSYLHDRGVVHRDLKPGNIFYDDGYVKIGDYGLSKHMSVSRHSGQTVSVGTVHYMAPEIGSGTYTKAIDIYALGVMLYEMLTGRLPFSGASMAEVLMRHLRDQPDLSGIPAPFAQVIAKALQKDPNDRYQDVNEMIAAIMDSDEINVGLQSFNAATLSQTPRAPEGSDPDRTMTSPAGRPPGPPPMDAREPMPAYGPANLPPLPDHSRGRLDRLSRKLDKKAKELEKRLGPGHGRRRRHHAPKPGHVIQRKPQLFILLAVTVAVSLGLGLFTGLRMPEAGFTIGLFIAAGVIGPLLTHLRFLRRAITRNPLIDRLAYAGIGGLFMIPAVAIAADGANSEKLAGIIFAPIAVLLLCDWSSRIEEGRAGIVQGWSAFWPAVIGLAAAAMTGAGEMMFIAAGVCAAMSLLTQAAAAMWPPIANPDEGPRLPGPGGPPRREPDVVPPPMDAPHLPAEGEPVATDDEIRQSAERTAAPPSPPPQQLVQQTMQPSFAGRATSAGLSFFGKIILLIGLIIAVGHSAVLQEARTAILHEDWMPRDPELVELAQHGLHPGIVFLPLAFGSLLMILARRSDGIAHFLRGCVGGALAILGGLMAMTIAGQPLATIFTTGDVETLAGPKAIAALVATAGALGLGILLLLWPKAGRQKTIVV